MFEPFENTLIERSLFGAPFYIKVNKIYVTNFDVTVEVENKQITFQKNQIIKVTDKYVLFRDDNGLELKLDINEIKDHDILPQKFKYFDKIPYFDINYFYCKNSLKNFLILTNVVKWVLPTNSRKFIILNNFVFEFQNTSININELEVIYQDSFVKILKLKIDEDEFKVYINLKVK